VKVLGENSDLLDSAVRRHWFEMLLA